MTSFRKDATDLIRPRLKSPPGMTQALVDGVDRIFDEAGVARDDGAAPKFAKAPGAPVRRALTDLLRPALAAPGMTQALVDGLDAIWDRCGVPKDGEAAAPTPPVPGPTPPAPAPAPAGAGTKLADEGAFFAAVRAAFGALRDGDQVPGIRAILAACGGGKWGEAFTANALGTAWLETNHTMQPVAEAYYLKNKVQDLDAWRRRKLRYYPYYGRGYVQLTWDYNYEKADKELGLGGTLLANLDRALEPDIAARVMVRGMEEGWFTAKALGKYLPVSGAGTAEQHKQARRVINGTDRWEDLSAYAMKFQKALQAGGWG
jgi:putative chitinase